MAGPWGWPTNGNTMRGTAVPLGTNAALSLFKAEVTVSAGALDAALALSKAGATALAGDLDAAAGPWRWSAY